MSPRVFHRIGALTVLSLLGLAGCGSQPAPEPGNRKAPDPSPSDLPDELPGGIVPTGYDGRFRTVTAVLESPEHGPQLCSYMEESYPPGCAGPDVIGWDWDGLAAEPSNGTTWGTHEVVARSPTVPRH